MEGEVGEMNERQFEIIMQSLLAIQCLLDGPPKDATCGGCRWVGETYECLADPPGGEPYIVDKDTPCCRHWRPK